jgi:hypothetical protein
MDKLKFQLETSDLNPVLTQIISKIMAEQMNILIEKLKEMLPPRQEPLYRIHELADMLKVSKKTIWVWLKTGKLLSPSFKACKRISHSEYLNFLNSPKYSLKSKRIKRNQP